MLDLERQLRDYGEYLDEQPLVNHRAVHHQRRPRAVLISAGFVVVFALTLGTWVVVRTSDSGTHRETTTTAVPLATPTDAGPELPLTIVPIPLHVSSRLVSADARVDEQAFPPGSIHRLFEGSHPLAVRPGDGRSVLLTEEIHPLNPTAGVPTYCMTIWSSDPNAADQGTACDPSGAFGYGIYPAPSSRFDEPPRQPTSALYMWSDLPVGTAYVTFRSSDVTVWQQPIRSNVVFPVPTGLTNATAGAYDADGQLLQQVNFVSSAAEFVPPKNSK